MPAKYNGGMKIFALAATCFALSIPMAVHAQTVLAQRDPAFHLNPTLYDVNANANTEIAQTIEEAKRDHKRVLLVFGGNWCLDCQVLDYRFHQNAIRPLVEQGYHVVHVDIGRYDKNLDVASKYETTLKRGVPVVAVLSDSGKLLYSQKNGEFESARSLDPEVIVGFLNRWKPGGKTE